MNNNNVKNNRPKGKNRKEYSSSEQKNSSLNNYNYRSKERTHSKPSFNEERNSFC